MAHSASLHPQGGSGDFKSNDREASNSAASWSAVIVGAFVTASLSLVLLALGAGLGLSSVSPWANSNISASTVGKSAIAWLILIQVIASALGGYLAGRLRTKWAAIHTDGFISAIRPMAFWCARCGRTDRGVLVLGGDNLRRGPDERNSNYIGPKAAETELASLCRTAGCFQQR